VCYLLGKPLQIWGSRGLFGEAAQCETGIRRWSAFTSPHDAIAATPRGLWLLERKDCALFTPCRNKFSTTTAIEPSPFIPVIRKRRTKRLRSPNRYHGRTGAGAGRVSAATSNKPYQYKEKSKNQVQAHTPHSLTHGTSPKTWAFCRKDTRPFPS